MANRRTIEAIQLLRYLSFLVLGITFISCDSQIKDVAEEDPVKNGQMTFYIVNASDFNRQTLALKVTKGNSPRVMFAADSIPKKINIPAGQYTVAIHNQSTADSIVCPVVPDYTTEIYIDKNGQSGAIELNTIAGLYIHYNFEKNLHEASGKSPLLAQKKHTHEYTTGVGGTGYALSLGDKRFLSFHDSLRFSPNKSATISFWLKTTQMTRFEILEQRVGSNYPDLFNFGISFNIYNERLSFSYPGYINFPEMQLMPKSSQFMNDVWNHFVFIKDDHNLNIFIYVNGSLLYKNKYKKTVFSQTGHLYLGTNYHFSNFYTGYIDDLRIYHVPMVLNQIKALYLAKQKEKSIL
jgi:hypothetical protein